MKTEEVLISFRKEIIHEKYRFHKHSTFPSPAGQPGWQGQQGQPRFPPSGMGGPPGYGAAGSGPQDRSGYGPRGPVPPQGPYGGQDPYGPSGPPGGWGKPGMRPPFRPDMRGPGPMPMRPVSIL